MTDKELSLLTHPEAWPHEGQLPVVRRGGNAVRNIHDAGIVYAGNLCRVWVGIYIGELGSAAPADYPSPEALLSEWNID